MQSIYNQENVTPPRGVKQVKVDNWGTFFLQRLLQLYFNEELLDLKIKFCTTNNVLNVHKIVISTCTDYFLQLQHEQSKGSFDKNVVTMPSDMPYECVKSIISFMYTGQLDYKLSDQNVLYRTAQKMNLTVLTKLLETQLEKSKSQNISVHDESNQSTSKQDQCLSKVKRLVTLPAEIPSNKISPVAEKTKSFQSINISTDSYSSHQFYDKSSSNVTEGPSRFDIPDIEDMTLGVFSSFDDITYNTKPIIQASEEVNGNKIIKSVLTDSLSNKFMEIEDDHNLRDQCKRSICSDTNSWLESESTMELDEIKPSTKKSRFSNNEKENHDEKDKSASFNIKPIHSVSNHAKIIREVLKKYPHLVQQNKNIRLKIMQKESKSSEGAGLSGKTKISYVVLPSDSLKTDLEDNEYISENIKESKLGDSENGFWKCTKCDLEEKYSNYSIYRMHMQGVHGYKFDPRICEYCGYKATKRNILMYHLYTKHNVPLPKSMSFPKCQVCSYVALTESLLIKHQNNHKHNDFTTDSVEYRQQKKKSSGETDATCTDSSFKNDADTSQSNELQLDFQQTNVRKYNTSYDAPTRYCVRETKNVENEGDIESEKKKYDSSKSESKRSQTKDQSQVRAEPSSNKVEKNKMLISNLKDNIVVCIQNNDNSIENIYHENDTIEEFENAEIIECENQKSGTKDVICEEQVVNQNDYYLSIDNTKEMIQYIEEETEILEYETNNA